MDKYIIIIIKIGDQMHIAALLGLIIKIEFRTKNPYLHRIHVYVKINIVITIIPNH